MSTASGTKMVKWEQDHFLSGFNQKGSGSDGSKARVVSSPHQVQLMTVVPSGSMLVPEFWGEYPKGIPFLSL